MASYRFCRSDDVPLLCEAHNACYLPHAGDEPPLDRDRFRAAAKSIDLWTSSCMVAQQGSESIAVLLAAKREPEGQTLIWRIAAHPDHMRRGHCSHLLSSLSAKLAILGPPRIVAELPVENVAARSLLAGCGFVQTDELTDYRLAGERPRAERSPLVIPISYDELLANGVLATDSIRCWARQRCSLAARRDAILGLAVASNVRIEAWMLHDELDGRRRLLALGCADESRREMWLGLLVRNWLAGEAREAVWDGVALDECPPRLLASWGFEAVRKIARLEADPIPG